MEKLSLYDLLSFVLPGGTFIILGFILFENNLQLPTNTLMGETVMIVPFLFVSYLTGHLISILGRFIETKILRFKTPWITFLKQNPEDTQLINKLCVSIFGSGFFVGESNEIDIQKSDKLFDKIYDRLELKEEDEKIKVLISQYALFRNSTAIWMILSLLLIVTIVLSLFGIELSFTQKILFLLLILSILFTFASVYLFKKRKLLAMSFVYRTFLAENYNHQYIKS